MKNSEETSSGFSLFSIDEHRLSVGLLVLFLLSITGYGIWLAIAPFLPQKAVVVSGESRKAVAEEHFKGQDWNRAIEVYSEMLRDDSENGYAALGIANTWEAQLQAKWKEYSTVSSTTGSANAGEEILTEESRLFEVTVNSWNRLLDNARFQRHAYMQLARLHCTRFTYRQSEEELEEAIEVLDEMLQKGLITSSGINQPFDLKPLANHPEFPRLVREEEKISNLDSGPSYFRRRPGQFNP